MRCRFAKSSQYGFTLIEVMIALAILAIALVALLYSFTMFGKRLQRVQHNLASQWLENDIINQTQSNLFAEQKSSSGRTVLFNETYDWKVEKLTSAKDELQKYQVMVTYGEERLPQSSLLVASTQLNFPKEEKRAS